jgi:hypothetical protein
MMSYQNVTPHEQTPGVSGFPQDLSPRPLLLPRNSLVDSMNHKELVQKLILFMTDRSAPYATSSLTHGITILMELFRRYYQEVEQVENYHQEYTQRLQQGNDDLPPLPANMIPDLSTEMIGLLEIISQHIYDFACILRSPKDVQGKVPTTLGLQEPVGAERLKVCDLFAELIHIQYLLTSSPLFEGLAQYYDLSEKATVTSIDNTTTAENTTVTKTNQIRMMDVLIDITDKLAKEKVLVTCLDLFFSFPWNNFLHSCVYDMIAKILNTYSYTSDLLPILEKLPETEAEARTMQLTLGQYTLIQVRQKVKILVLSLLEEGQLIQRVIKASQANEQSEKEKKIRLGYMGHLTFVSNEILKFPEKCIQDISPSLKQITYSEDWIAFVKGPLQLIKEKTQQPLGGSRPDPSLLGLPVTGSLGSFPGEDANVLLASHVPFQLSNPVGPHELIETVQSLHVIFIFYRIQNRIFNIKVTLYNNNIRHIIERGRRRVE